MSQEFIDEQIEKQTDKHFHEWNNVTGVFEKNTGYYFEILSVIEDIVTQTIRDTAIIIKKAIPEKKIHLTISQCRTMIKCIEDNCNELINETKGGAE